jgi:hypothetical protein
MTIKTVRSTYSLKNEEEEGNEWLSHIKDERLSRIVSAAIVRSLRSPAFSFRGLGSKLYA